jgi:nucleolar MIF4G domain-containing protein 1
MGKFKKKKSNPTFSKPKSRKEIRKEKRLSKKKRTRNERCQSEQTKVVPDTALPPKKKSLKKGDESAHDKQLKQREKDRKAFKELEEQMRKQRRRQLREANDEEDRVIKDLEKKLKLNRRKSKSLPKSFVSEGLDCIL